MAIWRRTDTPLIASRKPTDGHGWHADDDGSMIPLWFAGDCLPKVLIDNEDLLNFEESDDDDDDDDEDDDDVVGKDDVAYDDSDDDDWNEIIICNSCQIMCWSQYLNIISWIHNHIINIS